MGKNYLENFVQATFDALKATGVPVEGGTIVIGGDGRYHNRVPWGEGGGLRHQLLKIEHRKYKHEDVQTRINVDRHRRTDAHRRTYHVHEIHAHECMMGNGKCTVQTALL